MSKQVAFIVFLLIALGVFGYTCSRLYRFFKITKKNFPLDKIPERIKTVLLVAFGQTKIMRRPVIGFLHAIVWWGFIVVTIGTAEMVFDGLLGKERILGNLLGSFYNIIIGSGDIFATIILVGCIIFLVRRVFMHINRFYGVEMKKRSKVDANIALTMIILLMVSLIGMNMGYILMNPSGYEGIYPVSQELIAIISGWNEHSIHLFHEVNWWTHIVLVFVFLNVLPYSKHFHVIMSVPNVFFTRLEPMTKLSNMEAVTKEVKLMMDPDPNAAFAAPADGEQAVPERFGIKDVEDISWKNYADSLTCTECGRCTDSCPANITGKLLSPRKILIDTRRRMNDKGLQYAKDNTYSDGKALINQNYITPEELWACTTCNSCVQECPVNIDHVSMIMDMRRALVMEDSAAPNELNVMFSNIENNGAPWQFGPQDRMNWAEGITLNN